MKRTFFLVIVICLFRIFDTFGQTISVISAENLNVCENTEITVRIENNTGSTILAPTLKLELPCGIQYSLGSIKEASEKTNISVENPEFTVSNISVSEVKTIRMQVFLTCAALSCLDAQMSFIIKGALSNASFNTQFSSAPINTDSPNLVIAAVTNVYDEIPSYTDKNRSILVKNSRAGRVRQFRFTHIYDPYIKVKHDKGSVIRESSGLIELLFDSTDFIKIGNGDGWLDFNESIVINENVLVYECSYDIRFIKSEYVVSWGCQDKSCQKSSAIANIRVLDNDDLGDKLKVALNGLDPFCYDTGVADQKIVITKDSHKNALYAFKVKVDQPYLNRGILINSLVAEFANEIIYHDTFTNECGQKLAKFATITVARFEPSDVPVNLIITWQTGFCEVSDCNTPSNAWACTYEYRKECGAPGDGFFNKTEGWSNIKLNAFQGVISFVDKNKKNISPTILKDGQEGFLLITFEDVRLLGGEKDSFFVKLDIPKGVSLVNTDFILGGNVPVSVKLDTSGRNNVYDVVYLLPFKSAVVTMEIPFIFRCSDVLPPEVCIKNYASCICDEQVTDIINVFGELKLDDDCPEGSHPVVCTGRSYIIMCDNVKPCYEDTLAGSFGYNAQMFRTSYGISDQNYDGIADVDPTHLVERYRLDHFLPGDSFDIEFNGAIVVDKPGSTFSDVVLRIKHNQFIAKDSATADLYKSLMIGPGAAIKTYSTRVRIKQKSTGKTFELDKLNEWFHNGSYFLHLSSDSLLRYNPNSDFPSDYRYSEGDSIYVLISKYIDMQVFQQNNDKITVNQLFNFTYLFASYVGNELPNPNFDASPCDCDFNGFLIPPFYIKAPGVQVSTTATNPKICTDDFYYFNIFDIVVGHAKVLGTPYGQVFPFELRESIGLNKIAIKKSQDFELGKITVIYLEKVFDFDPVIQGDWYVYDMANTIPMAGSHSLVEQKNVIRINLALKPIKCINLLSGDLMDLKVFFRLNEMGKLYYPDSIGTKLQINFPKPEISTYIYQKEMTAFSNRFKAPFSITGPKDVEVIKNVFVKVTSHSGKIIDLRIRDTISNRVYLPQNGYFHIGEIGKNLLRHFELLGFSIGCGKDKLFLEYGFDCADYLDPAFPPCFIKLDTIDIDFPDGLVDLIVAQPSDPFILLCDTTIQKVTFYNAGLGNAYDMKVQLRLPQGLKFVPGSAFMYFPAGQTNTGFNIPDPVMNGQQILQWNLKDFWTEHQANGLNGTTFNPSNEFDIVYKTVSDCDFTSGLPIIYNINALKGCGVFTNKVTKNSPALNINGLQPLKPIDIQAKLTLTGPCSRDEAIINISFLKPSEPSAQLVLELPPNWGIKAGTISGNLDQLLPDLKGKDYYWVLNTSENVVSLSFTIQNQSDEWCISDLVNIYVADKAVANCVLTNQPCEIGNIAGKVTLPLEINQAIYDVTNVKIEKKDGIMMLYSEIERISGNWYGTVKGIVFLDKNGNGKLESGEQKVTTISYDGFSSSNNTSGEWVILSGLNEDQLCSLTLWISGVDNCLCEGIVKPLHRNVEIFEDEIQVCSETPVSIGNANLSGATYQWNENIGLSCTQCPVASFQLANHGNASVTYHKILSSTNNDCQIKYHYQITVHPLPKLLTGALTVCKGDTITAITSQAANYLWQGPGIIQNFQQLLIALPENSTSYKVSITDAQGCIGEGLLDVKVIPLPEYFVLNDSLFCQDSMSYLHVEVKNVDYYSWTNASNRLSHLDTLQPKINVLEDYIFTLEVRNGPCRKEVDIPINFMIIPEKVTDVVICVGETYAYGDKILSEAGKYCIVQKSVIGCDSTSCIQLKVKPLPDLSSTKDSIYKDIDIDLTIEGPSGYSNYLWTPSTDLSCTTCPSPITMTKDTITYTLEVTDEFGCITRKKIKILINDRCYSADVDIPNAFSPNDDGINDVFSLKEHENMCSMDLIVYNRWGNKVYEETNWNNRWTGQSQNGLPLPQGTYFIEITFSGSGIVKSSMVDLRKN